MPRLIAFLRAINVGGHTIKMDDLRRLFESLGFSGVETFIASGNVIFETTSKNVKALERQIEKKLRDALGYEVAVFIRTNTELAAIANYQPFPQSALDAAVALNVAFLADPLDDGSRRRLMALRTDIDDFHVHGREVFWLCRRKQSESTFSNAVLEKALGRQSTLRGVGTVKKIAAKYSSKVQRSATATSKLHEATSATKAKARSPRRKNNGHDLHLVFREVDKDRWADMERLFEGRGGPHHCWCMVWRATPEEAKRTGGKSRKAALKKRVEGGVPIGILGYLDDKPVAWCSIAPRLTYRRLGGIDEPGQDPERVWSLVCFFVSRELRGRGVLAQLIQASVEHARQRGATVVEAYPVDHDSPSYRFMGFRPSFEAAGFRQAGRAGSRRYVMRLNTTRPH